MSYITVGSKIRWTDNTGMKRCGTIAETVLGGEAVPEWYIQGQANPKGVRIRTRQRVARGDRYLVDCGASAGDIEYRFIGVKHPSIQIVV